MVDSTDLLMEEDKPIDFAYYLALVRKKLSFVITLVVVAAVLSVIYVAKIPTLYNATCKIVLETPKESWRDKDTIGEVKGPGGIGQQFFNTQIAIMMGGDILNKVVDELRLKSYFETDSEQVVVNRIRQMVKINRVRKSRLVNVTATAKDPNLAKNLSNSIAEHFLAKTFEDRYYYNQDFLKWLEMGKGNPDNIISITDASGTPKQVKYRDFLDTLPAIITDDTIREFRDKERTLLVDLDTARKKYRDKHPINQRILSNIKVIQGEIDREKMRIVKELRSKAAGEGKAKPGRIVEKSKGGRAVAVDRKKPIIMAVGAAFAISIALIILLDFFDNTIRVMEDFERKGIIIPFLGPLPLMPSLEGIQKRAPVLTHLAGGEEKTAVEEAFRYLRVAINFSAPPETVKVLPISSCLPGDGKSFCTTNLASSLALDGNRVLLIDGDLRRPVVHSTFNLNNDTGLSVYLTSNVDLDSVVKNCEIENLSIVCSGPVSPNPSEILGSERMKTFLKEVSENYDRIIIDCPPLTGIGDGFVVGGLIGHMILVVAACKTPADLIQHTQEHLKKRGIKILGSVLNRMDVQKERHSGFTKHYYNTYNKYYKRID